MSEFNYMGSGLHITDTEANDFIQNMKLHRSDCEDTTMLFELCTYCNMIGFEQSGYEHTLQTISQEAARQTAEEYMGSQDYTMALSSPRTYAQVARSPSPMFAMSHSTANPRISSRIAQVHPGASVQAPGFQTIEEWMDTSTYVASPAPRSTTERSYAAVASQAAEEAKLRARSRQQAPLPGNEYAQLNVARRAPAQGVPPSQATAQHHRGGYVAGGHAGQQRMLPPQSSTARMPFQNRLPQVMEDVTYAMRPERTPDPRNVNTLVQRTQRGSQRQTLAPSPAPYPSTPTSPGTISEASFASTRRTGDARYDPSLPHSCNTCHQTFRSNEDLKRHGRNVHQERQYPCEISGCNSAFVFPKDRKRHYESVAHAGVRVPKQCPYCPKTYTRKDNLERHIRNDHGSDSGIGASMSRSTSFSGAHSMSRSTSSASNYLAFSPPA